MNPLATTSMRTRLQKPTRGYTPFLRLMLSIDAVGRLFVRGSTMRSPASCLGSCVRRSSVSTGKGQDQRSEEGRTIPSRTAEQGRQSVNVKKSK